MPLYLYKCGACSSKRDVLKKLAELDRLEVCGACESLAPMLRQLCAPMVVADYPPYNCPITGDLITGRRAHEENLKKHGCRLYEPGETEQHKRRRADEETALDASVEATVDEFIATAPVEKREALAKADSLDLSVNLTRSTPTF